MPGPNCSFYEHLHTFNRSISEAVSTLENFAVDAGMPKDQLTCLGDHFRQLQSRTNALVTGVITERENQRSADLLQRLFRF